MAIRDVFSKRQRQARGEMPDVYRYDNLPNPLRVQFVHIVRDAFGDPERYHSETNKCLEFVHETLCREHGVFALTKHANLNQPRPEIDVYRFILDEPDIEKALDAVELSLQVINTFCRRPSFEDDSGPKMTPDQAIEEVNQRFREHGVGFQFESNQIVRIDSQVIHESAVRPALHLLQDKLYKGANEEYLRAHEHYRHGRMTECLNDSLKSLESVLKTIFDKRKWPYQQTDTAKALIKIAFDNQLVPSFLQTQFHTLQQNLESGVPTIRNKRGGHGQGAAPIQVPAHLAGYQLHMTASAILFLVECDKALK